MMDGFIFGFIDNAVLIISLYAGINIDKLFSISSNGVLGAVLGATIGNTFCDTLAALFDPTLQDSVKGITLGCIVPILIMIPIIEWMKRKNETKK